MADVRLIDANALLKEFEKRQEQQANEYCDCFLNDAQELSTEWWCVEDAVTAAPTISAVPVVRCSECKHFVKYDDDYRDEHNCDGYCEKISYIMDGYYHGAENRKADDFCSLGAKKDAKDIDVPTKDGGADNV